MFMSHLSFLESIHHLNVAILRLNCIVTDLETPEGAFTLVLFLTNTNKCWLAQI